VDTLDVGRSLDDQEVVAHYYAEEVAAVEAVGRIDKVDTVGTGVADEGVAVVGDNGLDQDRFLHPVLLHCYCLDLTCLYYYY